MRFDDVIIGGGLSGLVCGILLQKAGRKVLIVSKGQNAMHFSSGTFELLSHHEDGSFITAPLEETGKLAPEHPYSKIGAANVKKYVGMIRSLFAGCGVPLIGSEEKNAWMISPTGNVRPAWLALEDVTLLESPSDKIGNKVLIVNVEGFMDFNTAFIDAGLEKQGSVCRVENLATELSYRLKVNPTEMRSVHIAKIMDRQIEDADALGEFIAGIKGVLKDEDTVVLPSVFGLRDTASIERLKAALGVNVVFLGTMPLSVPGIRSQIRLKEAFEAAGGTFFLGDHADSAIIENGKVVSVTTANLGTNQVKAENVILASGSFFSKGLMSSPDRVYEPLFGADVDYQKERKNWYGTKFFDSHNYLSFGVASDEKFRLKKDGRTISNLYGIGSVLSGSDSISLGCGAGVAILTAMSVADTIINN